MNSGYLLTFIGFVCVFPLLADSDQVTIREDAACHNLFTKATGLDYVDAINATIASPDDARAILDAIAKAPAAIHTADNSHGCAGNAALTPVNAPAAAAPVAKGPNFGASDFYCLVHVFRWKDPNTDDSNKPLTADKQNWYVYHGGSAWRLEDFKDRRRIFGSRNTWLLFIHLNTRSNYKYEIRYDINLKDITPAPLNNALALAQLFAGSGQQAANAAVQAFIGMYPIKVTHLPNEMSIQSEAVAPPASGGDPTVQKLSDSTVPFTNEGRYHFDFGVAAPLRKISETTIDTNNGVVSPKTTGTTNAFGVLDLYPYPTDVRNSTFSYIPYVIAGVAIGKQPLHKILAAVGWGPKFAQFYFGALMVKQEQASQAQPAVRKHTGYEPQFSFGLNLTVRGFNDLRKKKT